MSAKVCDTCGEQIVFGRDEQDRLIPLDNLLAVYQIVQGSQVRYMPNGFRARHRCARDPHVPPPAERHFSEPAHE